MIGWFGACAIGNFDANCSDKVTVGVVIVGTLLILHSLSWRKTERDKAMSVSSF